MTEAEIRVLLARLPGRLWERLRAVRFDDRARGRRCLGYVTRGRDEINLCARPPATDRPGPLLAAQPVALSVRGGPRLPVAHARRASIYALRRVPPRARPPPGRRPEGEAKTTRRRFADETRAEEFAERWCRELWSQPFDHPDPVHGPPSREEIEALRDGWRVRTATTRRACSARRRSGTRRPSVC